MVQQNLQGTMEITLQSVDKIKIHESIYYQITYQTDETNTKQSFRINPEAFYPNPQPGDRVRVNWVMGNVMGAEKLS